MTSSWATSSLDLHLNVHGGRRRAALEDALRSAVRGGRLMAGTRLPSSRALAADLGMARNTVADAYAQLVAEGWLVALQGSGTRVAERAAAAPSSPPVRAAMPPVARFDLSAGAPDVSAFPRTAWVAAVRRAMASVSAEDLGYADPRGLPGLRTALAEYVSRARGVRAEVDQIVVCSGYTDGLDLIAEVLAEDGGGRRVGIEGYGHGLHRGIIERRGLRLYDLAVDGQGAVPEPEVDLRAVVLTPAHQFPIGSVLAPGRRAELVEWAGARDGLVVEDDYDGEFRFDRHPVGALQALAPDRVVFAGTASKTLVPGLRMGWLVVPPKLVGRVVEARRRSGRLTSVTDQLALADLIRSGGYDRHIRRARLAYRRRREQVVARVRHVAPGAQIVGAAAGLHLLLQLPPGVSESSIVAEAARRGLIVQGLGQFAHGDHDHPPALVIGYARPPEHAFSGALARLVATLQAVG